MKRLISIICAAAMLLFLLTACGEKEPVEIDWIQTAVVSDELARHLDTGSAGGAFKWIDNDTGLLMLGHVISEPPETGIYIEKRETEIFRYELSDGSVTKIYESSLKGYINFQWPSTITLLDNGYCCMTDLELVIFDKEFKTVKAATLGEVEWISDTEVYEESFCGISADGETALFSAGGKIYSAPTDNMEDRSVVFDAQYFGGKWACAITGSGIAVQPVNTYKGIKGLLTFDTVTG